MQDCYELSFTSKVSEDISNLYDYLRLIERVKKQMGDTTKLESMLEEIKQGEQRGFASLELETLKSQITRTLTW